jgi:hypothetical protein
MCEPREQRNFDDVTGPENRPTRILKGTDEEVNAEVLQNTEHLAFLIPAENSAG